jgi:HTH-type transcriptional regulator/antitoxin HigA
MKSHKHHINPRPFRPVMPGEILREELSARGWTHKRLAERLKRSPQAVSEIVNGRRSIDAEIALALADAFKTSPEFWMNLEVNYRLDLARSRRRVAG